MAAAAGWQPAQTAALLAPAIVSAVDGGHVPAVAQAMQLLFNARQQPLLMWLLEAMAAGLERADAAAAVAWEAMQHPGGAGKGTGRKGGHAARGLHVLVGIVAGMPADLCAPSPPSEKLKPKNSSTVRPCPPPAVAASDLSALLAVDRHHRTTAALAVNLYNLPGAAEQVCLLPPRLRLHVGRGVR